MSDEGYLIHRESVPRIFRAVRAIEDGSGLPPTSRRRVLSEDGGFLLVKTTDQHDQGETQACLVLQGGKGEEEETEEEIPCYNRFGDLPEEAVAIAAYVGSGWELIAAVCGGGSSEEEEEEEPEEEDSEDEDDEQDDEEEGEE